ncbi:helix-turn-helix domain-containing protein [Streptomyces sp. NPDC127092]|uniref:helix-turn-helix domain-containing protein n=1 Tax=Streptomyces sp. NPDC127092 TaxID=3347135 RepID=UPI00364AF9C3
MDGAKERANGLAALLRELKERSGLSYGALARQLHVSTSTLHRYCNGDAVPAEFAPVERLGRLCGASRDELVALHRAWIVADDARRRGKTGPEQAEPAAPADPAAAAAAAAAAVSAASAVPAATGASAVPAATGEAQADVPAAPAEPGTPTEPAAPVEPVVPSEPPELTTTVLVADGPTGPGQPSRPSHTRLKGAIAAAAVVVLAVPGAYLVGRVGDTAPDDDRAAAPATTAPAPLSVGISSYNWAEPCGQYFLLDQDPGHVPPPPPPQDTRTWGRSLGGVDGGHMQLQLTVTGRTQAPVVLGKLHVRVVERDRPLDRTAYSMGDGCGSGITPQTFDVDLDAPRPYAKPVAGQDGDGVVPAKDFPYKVATGDPQVLNLDVHTEEHATAWYLELDWSSGDQKGRIRVDDGGEPFRTSAIEGRPTYGYQPDKGEWGRQ